MHSRQQSEASAERQRLQAHTAVHSPLRCPHTSSAVQQPHLLPRGCDLSPSRCPQIEEGVEAFVEAQIIKIEDNKWGNKLSQVCNVVCHSLQLLAHRARAC